MLNDIDELKGYANQVARKPDIFILVYTPDVRDFKSLAVDV